MLAHIVRRMLGTMSSPLRNFALPGLALLGLAAYWLWRSSMSPTPAAAPETTTPPAAAPRDDERSTRAGDPDSRRVEPELPGAPRPTAGAIAEDVRRTRRDRAASDALRLALRERQRGSSSRTGGKEPAADEPAPNVLDKDYIRARIQEDLLPIAEECYEAALEDEPKLGGKLTMSFSIVGDEEVGGVVDEAAVDPSSEIVHPGLTECMRESMLSLSFAPPEDGGTVQVVYPFVFAPGGA